MSYPIIDPPISLDDFWHKPKKDLVRYYNWFISQIPERIRVLEEVVQKTPGFQGWKADYSEESLIRLGEWFREHAEERPSTLEEIEKEKNEIEFPSPIEVSERTLTDRTISLTYDIGIYFAESLRRRHPVLHWVHFLKSKRSFDYGRPVLIGTGKVAFPPVWVMQVLASQFARKVQPASRFTELYKVWEETLLPES